MCSRRPITQTLPVETFYGLRMPESKPTGGIQKATQEEKTDVRVGGPPQACFSEFVCDRLTCISKPKPKSMGMSVRYSDTPRF